MVREILSEVVYRIRLAAYNLENWFLFGPTEEVAAAIALILLILLGSGYCVFR